MERRYTYSTFTDVGKRKENEDSFLFKSKRKDEKVSYLGVVSDGMGGSDAGSVASGRITKFFEEWYEQVSEEIFEKNIDDYKIMMNDLISKIHEDLIEYADEKILSLGATLTAFLAVENVYVIAHVGDSRAYLYSEGKLTRKTKDQTYIQQAIDKGLVLSNKEYSDNRHVIVQCVGSGEVVPQYYEGLLPEEYKVLLCSDGLHNTLSIEAIEEVLKKEECGKKMLQDLANLAKERGETDNITGIIIGKK